MCVKPAKKGSSLRLPEHTLTRLDELIRCGRFKSRQTAVAAAVERLYVEEHRHLTARQEAVTRLCGALQLGTTRESLRSAERDRLDWESEQR